MEKPSVSNQEMTIHPHPHYYPIHGSPSYIEKKRSDSRAFTIRKSSTSTVKRKILADRSQCKSENKFSRVKINDDALFPRKKAAIDTNSHEGKLEHEIPANVYNNE